MHLLYPLRGLQFPAFGFLHGAVRTNKVKSIEFYDGSILLGTVSNGPPYTFLWTNGPAGNHTLFAREIDLDRITDSALVNIVIFSSTNGSSLLNVSLLPDMSLQLDMFGPAVGTIWLEAATSIGPGAEWIPLTTNTSGAGSFQFIISDPTNYPQRFYRMVTMP